MLAIGCYINKNPQVKNACNHTHLEIHAIAGLNVNHGWVCRIADEVERFPIRGARRGCLHIGSTPLDRTHK